MVEFASILIAITALFGFYFLLRNIFGLKLCAICAAISTTWIGLLALWFWGIEVDLLAVAMLMGGSAVGLMYLLEAKLPERWSVLKLPFLLTLFALIYVFLTQPFQANQIYLVIAALWLIFLPLFLSGEKGRFQKAAQKIIECCKNW